MFKQLLFAAIIGITATFSPMVISADTEGENLLYCEFKYDATKNFTYDPKNVTVIHPKDFNITIHVIVDVDGEELVFNNYELENFDCSKVDTDK